MQYGSVEDTGSATAAFVDHIDGSVFYFFTPTSKYSGIQGGSNFMLAGPVFFGLP